MSCHAFAEDHELSARCRSLHYYIIPCSAPRGVGEEHADGDGALGRDRLAGLLMAEEMVALIYYNITACYYDHCQYYYVFAAHDQHAGVAETMLGTLG